ncbi:hypothetical protein Taro_012292 [Colocasia esculenta]|uniref:Protein PLASTID MOVEMENT IMPAIRED 2 n=1 Tax=Colocasia esculenta TaxID=4460 RepID=A0A843UF68_COLES|nr:hypothetical protein [Colocasia esculenta]
MGAASSSLVCVVAAAPASAQPLLQLLVEDSWLEAQESAATEAEAEFPFPGSRTRKIQVHTFLDFPGMKSEAADRVGSVSSAISLFGERIHGRKQERNKAHFSSLEESSSNTRELHLANKNIGRFSELKRSAEYERARAESELSSTRKTVKELRSQIEESTAKAKFHKEETQILKNPETPEGQRATAGGQAGNHKYEELMKELESLKEELSKLKLDMFHAFEGKVNAEKETEALEMKAATYMNMVGELVKEIENVNEEHVLVEIARLEAVREAKEVDAQREAAFAQYSKKIKQAKDQIREMTKEVSKVKSLEEKLAATNEDLNVLQCEMELVRAMMKNSNDSDAVNEEEKRRREAMESGDLLRSAKSQLEAAKKELVSVKDEGFQLMASMDAVREELKQISKETDRLRRLEEKHDLTVQNLNSKLLRAKSRLEVVTASEEKARGIVSNLGVALQQLQSEAECARKEKEQTIKDTEIIEMDITKTDIEIGLAEQRLEAAIEELERVKASEAAALDRLKLLSERALKARASSGQHSSFIRISKFEYEYLIGHAEGAKKVADKKVAAAQAWVEALKASEKEMMMKIEMAQREIRDLEVVEVKEINRMQKSLTLEKELESELSKYRELEGEAIDTNLQLVAAPRKSLKENGVPTTPRKSRIRRRSSISYGTRQFPRSPSITLRRKKVMPSLVKFLQGRRSSKHK